uniref:G-protein coupled receptors family 1 profile domain-containing protein n=2 Tax=Panagrolaimus sp. PS1159 TaxID=55785 RepID=A0AC35FXR4_9BILA
MNETNITSLGAIWQSPYSPFVQVFIWIVAVLLSLETIIGNAMVIIAYKLQRSISKQVSNRYIVSLAISDLIIGIEGIPLFTVYVVNGDRWPLGAIACETWLFLDYTLCLVSILTVLLITADRYLSVCHTAKYLKWQSPTKTQVLIILSWIFPAVMFGVMIYGWSFLSGGTGGDAAYEEGECFAPFLSNPYVNMGMYVAYYWTTLVAMLILYKGIHQAAKNLEKKAKAKEHRHIALLLTQRLGTQVGVSLMLQSRRSEGSIHGDNTKDSGYHTGNLVPGNHSEVTTLEIIKEKVPKEQVIRRNKLTGSQYRTNKNHPALRSVKSATLTVHNHNDTSEIITPDEDKKFQDLSFYDFTTANSFSTIFNDDSFSSVLHFKKMSFIETPPDLDRSDTSSIICEKRHSITSSLKGRRRSSKYIQKDENIQEYNAINVTDENGHITSTIEYANEEPEQPRPGFFRRMMQWFTRPIPVQQNTRSRSSSTTSSCSSSSEMPNMNNHPHHRRKKSSAANPTITITRENKTKTSVATLNPERDRSDPFLSTMGVSRKVSTLSSFTKDTRDRVLQSLFSPIVALNRGRKQTRAEKRAHKAFRTITFIVGFFAILWSPYYVVATIYGFCKGECIPSLLYNLSYYMCYLNSSGNPFAYALANRQFRSAFGRILRGNFHRVT